LGDTTVVHVLEAQKRKRHQLEGRRSFDILVDTQEVMGSSPVAPTMHFQKFPDVAVSVQSAGVGDF